MATLAESETLPQKAGATADNKKEDETTPIFDRTEDGFPLRPGAVHVIGELLFRKVND